jgi:hypothetical protein
LQRMLKCVRLFNHHFGWLFLFYWGICVPASIQLS